MNQPPNEPTPATGPKPDGSHLALGVAFGLVFGAGIGVAFGNVALGAAFGLVIGAATSVVIDSQRSRHDGGS